MQIQFLGAADAVTGSRHLVTLGDQRILLDCGLFQGWKVLRERNWAPLGVPPHTIDAVVLSHAHLDHSGWLPRPGEGRLSRAHPRQPRHLRPGRGAAARQRPPAGRRRPPRQPAGLFKRHAKALPLYTKADAFRRAIAQHMAPLGTGQACAAWATCRCS